LTAAVMGGQSRRSRRNGALDGSGYGCPLQRSCWRILARPASDAYASSDGSLTRTEPAHVVSPQPIGPVPDETARIARAAFPGGNIYMALRDELGTIFRDEDFAALYPTRGRPAETPWRLALVTVMQFAEGSPTAAPTTRCAAGSAGAWNLSRAGIRQRPASLRAA
jgi:hypothetical protein